MEAKPKDFGLLAAALSLIKPNARNRVATHARRVKLLNLFSENPLMSTAEFASKLGSTEEIIRFDLYTIRQLATAAGLNDVTSFLTNGHNRARAKFEARRMKLLELYTQNPSYTGAELASKLKCGIATVHMEYGVLKRRGLVSKRRTGPAMAKLSEVGVECKGDHWAGRQAVEDRRELVAVIFNNNPRISILKLSRTVGSGWRAVQGDLRTLFNAGKLSVNEDPTDTLVNSPRLTDSKWKAAKERRAKLLSIFKSTPNLLLSEVAGILGVSKVQVGVDLTWLRKRGVLAEAVRKPPKIRKPSVHNWAAIQQQLSTGLTLREIYDRDIKPKTGELWQTFKSTSNRLMKESERTGLPLSTREDGQAELIPFE